MAFRKCGVVIPSDDGLAYHSTWWRNHEDRLQDHLRKSSFLEVTDPQKGDVVTFRLFGSQYPPHHCGILVSFDQVIHVSGIGDNWESCCRTMPISPAWQKRVAGYFRYKGFMP
jgi:cell wall-associated NlpC family hydrolase